jgi:hypothetical protein
MYINFSLAYKRYESIKSSTVYFSLKHYFVSALLIVPTVSVGMHPRTLQRPVAVYVTLERGNEKNGIKNHANP